MSDAQSPQYPPPPAYVPGPVPQASPPGKTLGIVALIVAFFFQLLGLILGIVALVQSRKAGLKNLPAVWAIIVSAVLMVLGIIIAIVVLTTIAGAAAYVLEQCNTLGLETGTYELSDGVTITCP